MIQEVSTSLNNSGYQVFDRIYMDNQISPHLVQDIGSLFHGNLFTDLFVIRRFIQLDKNSIINLRDKHDICQAYCSFLEQLRNYGLKKYIEKQIKTDNGHTTHQKFANDILSIITTAHPKKYQYITSSKPNNNNLLLQRDTTFSDYFYQKLFKQRDLITYIFRYILKI